MKRLFCVLILFLGFFTIAATPLFFVSAQEKMSECCKIKQDFVFGDYNDGSNLQKDCVIGAEGGYCRVDNKDVTLGTTKLSSAKIILTTFQCGKTDKRISEQWGMVCILSTVYNVTNWLFYLMTVVAVLLFIIGGVFYMASAGEPEKAKKGKTIIIYGIIGLVIGLIAKMIPSMVKTIVQ